MTGPALLGSLGSSNTGGLLRKPSNGSLDRCPSHTRTPSKQKWIKDSEIHLTVTINIVLNRIPAFLFLDFMLLFWRNLHAPRQNRPYEARIADRWLLADCRGRDSRILFPLTGCGSCRPGCGLRRIYGLDDGRPSEGLGCAG